MAPSTHAALPDPRNADVLVYVDGDFVHRAEAAVSVFDSAFLIGDGIWEGLRYHDGRFLHLDRHLDRLFATADAVYLDIGKTSEELADILQATVDRNGMTSDAHVRLMVSRGTKRTALQDPRLSIRPTVVVIAEWKVGDPDLAAAGLRLHTSQIRRPPPTSLDQRWNSHSKLHEVVALSEAIVAGADEALMLDIDGNVATCNSTNFFIVRGGALWTSTGEHCLNGITRATVLELAEEAGIPAYERAFTVDDVYAADEAFVTGTFGGLTPVAALDGRTIGSGSVGPVTQRLTAAYREALSQ
ncbi:MAG: aminotransferase class IV [Acidimicrobiia bacterium]|nr:aminotransferase class IV [Acidimicrobiia bacterium]